MAMSLLACQGFCVHVGAGPLAARSTPQLSRVAWGRRGRPELRPGHSDDSFLCHSAVGTRVQCSGLSAFLTGCHRFCTTVSLSDTLFPYAPLSSTVATT